MSSMLPPSIILPPETAPNEPIGSQTPTVDPNTGLNPYFDQFNQMQQGFQNTMQQIQNDPFPLLEHFLGQRAMSQVDQAMQPMQQEALQKVSGVMSGIRSLVNEAFPNMGGGMSGGGISTTGQLGQGIASLGGTAIPAAPFTKPAEIPSTPMQPPTQQIMSDLSQISTPQITQPENDILNKFGITTTNYQGPVTLPGGTGPNTEKTYVGGTLVTPDYVPKVGLGGDPDAPKTNLPPAQMLSLFNQQMGGSPVDNVFQTSLTPIGETSFEDLSQDKQSEILAGLQKAQQNLKSLGPTTSNPFLPPSFQTLGKPLLNLAYNFNMENSPF